MEVILVIANAAELSDLQNKVEAVYHDAVISSFQSAEKAMKYAKKKKIDVCFTEVVLNTMSGIALAKELKKQSEDVKINFISDTEEYALDGWKLFINDYLLKPVSVEDIRHSMERM